MVAGHCLTHKCERQKTEHTSGGSGRARDPTRPTKQRRRIWYVWATIFLGNKAHKNRADSKVAVQSAGKHTILIQNWSLDCKPALLKYISCFCYVFCIYDFMYIWEKSLAYIGLFKTLHSAVCRTVSGGYAS